MVPCGIGTQIVQCRISNTPKIFVNIVLLFHIFMGTTVDNLPASEFR